MEMIEIEKGGRYKVTSSSGGDEPMITDGEFVGYTVLSEEAAMVFRVKTDGKTFMRMIPVSGIFSIEFENEDLLKTKSKKHEAERTNYIN